MSPVEQIHVRVEELDEVVMEDERFARRIWHGPELACD